MKTTEEVLNHHLGAFNEGIDVILSDYTENSMIMTQQGTFKGMSAIRDFFTNLIQSLPDGFMDALNINTTIVDGEIAYIAWESLPWFPLATDTFVIRDEKIQYQTFAAYQAS